MRILMVGGSAFVGRHIAQAALDAGHDVTLFHRGKTGAGLFPAATHVTGDRNADLSALAGPSWDATIDTCGYFPGQVRSLAAALDGSGGRYVFISSVSAYSAAVPWNYDETAPLAEIGDPDATEITEENYGGLKVACERAATQLFGPDTTIVRPTFVIGPYDRSYRFTWWVDRLARGGRVLAPGRPDDPIQLIDARDQGSWIISLLERSITGTFHTVSPAPPFGFGQMLAEIAAEVAPAGTELVWVDSEFLVAEGVDYNALPLWSGGESEGANLNTASPAAAYAAGLSPRPLRQSVADIRAAQPLPDRPEVGLSPDREAELLARWDATRRAGRQ
jgi:2'-hydroxyisoflavone reductase